MTRLASMGRQGARNVARLLGRRLVLVQSALVCTLLYAGTMGTTPSNATSFTWAGLASGRTESAAYWSNGMNWEGGVAPSNSQAFETLTFRHLTNSECTSEPETDTCYLTLNNLSGLSVGSINLDDADNYLLAGEGITLGSGGLTASPGASRSAGSFLEMPVTLSASQNWSVTSGGGELEENGLAIGEPITGAGKSLSIELSKEAALFMGSNVEVGSLALNGANTGQAGIFNGVVDLLGSNLNASNGQPVELNHIFAVGSGSLGELTMHSGVLAVLTTGIEAASLRLNSASRLNFSISGAGTGGNSQLNAHGPVALEGGEIEVIVRPPKKGEPCPVLTAGQTYTFLSTTGALSGSFSNALEGGAEIPIEFAKACGTKSQMMRIAYTRTGDTQKVTGTVEAYVKEREEKQEQEERAAKEREEKGKEELLKKANARTKKVEEEVAATARKYEEAEMAAKRVTEGLEARHHEEEAANQRLLQSKSKPLTRSQKLAKALKACKKLPKKKRAKCIVAAKKKYASKLKMGKIGKKGLIRPRFAGVVNLPWFS
jgi:hypothetical protein